MKNLFNICANFIRDSKSIVALTGAGISTSAGIPDFRGPSGIYSMKKYDTEKIFELTYFLENPELFYDFARDFLSKLEVGRPTFTHLFLAQLERAGKLEMLITQNIDGLHECAGSKNLINLHGNINKSYCLQCSKEYPLEQMRAKVFNEKVPFCDKCGGLIKPDIVFFGEGVKEFSKAEASVYNSDLLLIIGTSLEVYPANLLADFSRGKTVFVGKTTNTLMRYFDLHVDIDIDSFFKGVYSYLKDLTGEISF
jgi:NAD-dependent deacetylase